MTTSIDRKALDRAKGLINTVSGAMRNVSASLAGISSEEEFKATHDAQLVEASLPEVSKVLDDVFSYLADSWTEIKDNEVRLYEVYLFVQDFRRFEEMVNAFDDVCNESTIEPRLFADPPIGNEFYLLVSRFHQRLKPVLEKVDFPLEYKQCPRFSGIAEALRPYIRKANDEVLEGIITGTSIPEEKLRWTGPLNEATLFGQHYSLPCKWMNDCFEFRSKDKRPVRLNYTHNRVNNDVKEYRIFDILVKYPIGK